MYVLYYFGLINQIYKPGSDASNQIEIFIESRMRCWYLNFTTSHYLTLIRTYGEMVISRKFIQDPQISMDTDLSVWGLWKLLGFTEITSRFKLDIYWKPVSIGKMFRLSMIPLSTTGPWYISLYVKRLWARPKVLDSSYSRIYVSILCWGVLY